MRAQSEKEPVQGVRRGEHLPARSDKEPVQGVRRGEHLPAQSEKEPMQDMRQSRQGRVNAAGSRGALDLSHALPGTWHSFKLYICVRLPTSKITQHPSLFEFAFYDIDHPRAQIARTHKHLSS